jgi:hypothetical protein
MYSINDVRPVQVSDLTRVGRKQDGGYVLSQRQVDKTKLLLSFGISLDWSFESDFLKRAKTNTALYAYDYSVSASKIRMRCIAYLIYAAYLLAIFRISEAKRYFAIGVDKLLLHPFRRFFTPKKNRFFTKKFLGGEVRDEYTNIQEVFAAIGAVECLSVFVKMDIEQFEYRTLPQFKPYYKYINGFAIEFHDLDILGGNFTEIIKEMSVDFHVIHAHANNYGGCITGTCLPVTLEITLINKKIYYADPAYSTNEYPVKGLDFPCNSQLPDIPIVFNNHTDIAL